MSLSYPISPLSQSHNLPYQPLALTGGIACGKTTICEIFKSQGFEIINSDALIHSFYVPTHPHYPQLAAELDDWLGTAYSNNPNGIERANLRTELKNDKNNLKKLTDILTPYLLKTLAQELKNKSAHQTIVEVPLLFESGLYPLFSPIICVSCSLDTRLSRLQKRSPYYSLQDIETVLAAQYPLEEKIKKSDFVIDNNTEVSLEKLTENVQSLIKELQSFIPQLRPCL